MQDNTPALGFYLNEYHYVVRNGANQRQMCVLLDSVYQLVTGQRCVKYMSNCI